MSEPHPDPWHPADQDADLPLPDPDARREVEQPDEPGGLDDPTQPGSMGGDNGGA